MPLIAVTGHMKLTPLTQKPVRSGIHELLAKAPGWAHRHHVPGQGCRPDLRSRLLDLGRTLVVVRQTADYRERKLDLRDPPCSTSC